MQFTCTLYTLYNNHRFHTNFHENDFDGTDEINRQTKESITSGAKDTLKLNSTQIDSQPTAEIVAAAAVVVFISMNLKTVCMNVERRRTTEEERVSLCVERKKKEEERSRINMDELTCNWLQAVCVCVFVSLIAVCYKNKIFFHEFCATPWFVRHIQLSFDDKRIFIRNTHIHE